MSKYQKLVRDKIPEIIRENGEVPVTKELKGEQYKQALMDKLLEEASEVVEAGIHEELIKEIGDVQEVLAAIVKAHGLDSDEIEKLRRERAESRGAFDAGVYLQTVDENE